MKAVKGIKPKKEAHTSSSKIGMGDFYGSGVKQKTGRVRESYMEAGKPSNLKRPPKSLA